ncbi:MAG: tyrosine-protein phosphatase [Oscillospiraceae bacterium]|jgi:protein-tyrosine phosphatase|nr:tyrosine-protein phosphatase [Oscillospiraceae bacterium]
MALIAMKGCPNFRDLGGFYGHGGKITKQNRVFRSDCLSKLTDEDIALFKQLGIRFVIDLRSAHETESSEYPLHVHEDIGYESLPLSDDLNPENLFDVIPKDISELYRKIVDDFGTPLTRVFELIAEHAQLGGVVFHCTAGKDRTGVVAALLLLLNGVVDGDIIADYAQSYENMKPYFDAFAEPFIKMKVDIPQHVFRSDPDSMRRFLEYFRRTYGGVEEYLTAHNIKNNAVETLKNIL